MNLTVDFWDYAIFIGLVVFSMVVDHVMHKDDKPVSLQSAVKWSIFWVLISFVYAGFLYLHHDSNTASLFISGYVLEKVLSVDNLFVFSAIFAWFNVPNEYRHRILYWGVIGAIVFRLIFVVIGAGLLQKFGSYAEILFAGLIIYAAVMMLRGGDDDEETDYENHVANRIVHKFFPVVPRLFGHKFFVKGSEIDQLQGEEKATLLSALGGKLKQTAWYATPLFVCVAVVELSDVMFAFDSVPAVIAISKEPLIVYSAMLFAILGLRTLYFVLEALKDILHHLEKAIIVLLFFIGVKMLGSAMLHLTGYGFEISPNTSLVIVLSVLAVGVIASLVHKEPEQNDPNEPNNPTSVNSTKTEKSASLTETVIQMSEEKSKLGQLVQEMKEAEKISENKTSQSTKSTKSVKDTDTNSDSSDSGDGGGD